MTVQSLTDNLQKLYLEGKYKDCLARVEEARKKDLPADEMVAVLVLGAQIKRELTDLGAAADMLEHAKLLVDNAKDPFLEPSVELALNAVHSSLMKNKDAAKVLVNLSESALTRMKHLPRGARYDKLHLTGLCDLGMTKINAGEIALAAQNLRVASGTAEELYGSDSQEMIYPSICLAAVHALEKKQSLSLAVARSAAQTARANFGNSHPLLIHPLYMLAQACHRQGLFQASLDTCRQVEGLIVDNIGRESDIYVDVLAMKTAAFMFMVENASAEKAASERLALMEKMRGKDSPKIIDPLCDLAQILVQMGEREKAEKHFDRALKLVSELARDKGFPESPSDGAEPPASTTGSRIGDASLCHLESDLIERLSDCYLWQGKLADVAKLMPNSMRSRHTSRFDAIVSVIDSINKRFEDFGRKADEV
jgi:tetratricopeptide (TPR) repeat protein